MFKNQKTKEQWLVSECDGRARGAECLALVEGKQDAGRAQDAAGGGNVRRSSAGANQDVRVMMHS
jgi:hypothetical protein